MRTSEGFLVLSVTLNILLSCLAAYLDQDFTIEFDTSLINTNVAMFEAISISACTRNCLASRTCQYAAYNNQTEVCIVPNDITNDQGTHAPGWMFIKAKMPASCTDCVRFGSSWYKFVTEYKVSMTDGQSICEKIGGKLVEVETALENNFLKDQLSALNTLESVFWMGAYSHNSDMSYQWTSNPNENISFVDFHPNEPNPNSPGGENCLAFFQLLVYGWINYPCTSLQHFVCELPV